MKKICAKIIYITLTISLVFGSVFNNTYASSGFKNDNKENKNSIGTIGGYLATRSKSAKTIYNERLFKNPTGGHGFAAEEANNLSDVLRGKKAKIVGRDLIKDGPDRMIKNRNGSITWIQDKYWKTANGTLEAAFDKTTGDYRYVDPEGKPMQLEVPKEQYEFCKQTFAKKIREGKVPNVSDPSEANNIVRQGRYTFKQAVNITKAFNKDSIIYDAKQGILISTCAVGISFAIDFASCIINGDSVENAIKNSSLQALKTGGIVLGSNVIARQLAKTSLADALAPKLEPIVNMFGEKFAKNLMKSVGESTGKQLISSAAKVLATKIVLNTVFIVILEIPDIIDIFRGRISKEQFIKNLSVTLAGLGGAVAGAKAGGAVGSLISPGVGTAAGIVVGVILGAASAYGAKKISDYIYEDDADKMFRIVTKQFQKLGEEYLITRKEADVIVEDVKGKFTADVLKDMFSSKKKNKFARKILEPYFEKTIKKRERIKMPSRDDIRLAYKQSLNGIVYIH